MDRVQKDAESNKQESTTHCLTGSMSSEAPHDHDEDGWGSLPWPVLAVLANIIETRYSKAVNPLDFSHKRAAKAVRRLNKHWYSCMNASWSTLVLEGPPRLFGEFVPKFTQLRCLALTKVIERVLERNWALKDKPDDFPALSQMHNLVELRITDLSDADIVSIRDLQKLRSLEVRWREVCVSLFERVTQLEELKIQFEKVVDPPGFGGLVQMQNLISLELVFIGMPSRFEVGVLSELTKLTHLRLNRCLTSTIHPNDVGFSNLVELRSLQLHKSTVTDAILGSLSWLTNLTSLELDCSRPFLGHGLSSLNAMKQLKELKMHASTVSDLSAVYNLRSLERLDLSCSRILDSQLKGLTNLRRLRRLDLEWCASLSRRGFKGVFDGMEGLKVNFLCCEGGFEEIFGF
ncbi:hypothetical protein BSKO_12350 [Bryopsis sp. KO-2023]|nr:hypothetical protein BSKO_12350 [Bryopsis sp. KO-2023]